MIDRTLENLEKRKRTFWTFMVQLCLCGFYFNGPSDSVVYFYGLMGTVYDTLVLYFNVRQKKNLFIPFFIFI